VPEPGGSCAVPDGSKVLHLERLLQAVGDMRVVCASAERQWLKLCQTSGLSSHISLDSSTKQRPQGEKDEAAAAARSSSVLASEGTAPSEEDRQREQSLVQKQTHLSLWHLRQRQSAPHDLPHSTNDGPSAQLATPDVCVGGVARSRRLAHRVRHGSFAAAPADGASVAGRAAGHGMLWQGLPAAAREALSVCRRPSIPPVPSACPPRDARCFPEKDTRKDEDGAQRPLSLLRQMQQPLQMPDLRVVRSKLPDTCSTEEEAKAVGLVTAIISHLDMLASGVRFPPFCSARYRQNFFHECMSLCVAVE
jgi:hypothetical protein